MHNPKIKMKWDHKITNYKVLRKIGRVSLIHIDFATHPLDGVKRDSFEKKFGFSVRPGRKSMGGFSFNKMPQKD